jgi:hypothetical protein
LQRLQPGFPLRLAVLLILLKRAGSVFVGLRDPCRTGASSSLLGDLGLGLNPRRPPTTLAR